MKELQNILQRYQQHSSDDCPFALATVVNTQGSVYRRAGAKMLVQPNGARTGTISGGCLENDICSQAQLVLETGQPLLASYDAIANEDILWGLGIGCNGKVDVLIEPLVSGDLFNPLDFVETCLSQRRSGLLATVFQSEDETIAPIGAHLLYYPSGKVADNLPDSRLREQILQDAQTAQRLGQSVVKEYSFSPGGELNANALTVKDLTVKDLTVKDLTVKVLIEIILLPTPLVIFGAGQDAMPVASFAKALGWEVTVVDRRAAYATADRFPTVDRIIVADAETSINQLGLSRNTVAIVMTHDYFDDRDVLKMLLPSAVGYIGQLGPYHRTQRLLQDLSETGVTFSETQLQRLHAPVGLDIGADTPEEIALSILAEIRAVLASRTGGFLRDRPGSIHPRDRELKADEKRDKKRELTSTPEPKFEPNPTPQSKRLWAARV